jgi:hypothetical protein
VAKLLLGLGVPVGPGWRRRPTPARLAAVSESIVWFATAGGVKHTLASGSPPTSEWFETAGGAKHTLVRPPACRRTPARGAVGVSQTAV